MFDDPKAAQGEPSCCGMFDDPKAAQGEPSCCGMFDDPKAAQGEPSCCGMFDDPKAAQGEPSCCGMFDDPKAAQGEPSCCGMFDDPKAAQRVPPSNRDATNITRWQMSEALRVVEEMKTLPVFVDLKLKLTHPVYGPDGGWTSAFTEQAFTEYIRFMALAHAFGEAVPSKAIDEVWHGHIIDTRRYEKDCLRIFGRFLHHYPYFGLGGAHGEHSELVAKFERTSARYAALFGEKPTGPAWGGQPKHRGAPKSVEAKVAEVEAQPLADEPRVLTIPPRGPISSLMAMLARSA
jgi:hypothetical protein